MTDEQIRLLNTTYSEMARSSRLLMNRVNDSCNDDYRRGQARGYADAVREVRELLDKLIPNEPNNEAFGSSVVAVPTEN